MRDVANGGAAVDPRVVDGLLRAREHGATAASGAHPRERDILRLIAEGRSNNAIADELDITTRSVEHSINAIFAKLGLQRSDDVNRRVQATLMYLAGADADGSG